jgi:hypothetical protein
VRERADGQDVCIQEDDLGILGQPEYMKFCQDCMEIRTP